MLFINVCSPHQHRIGGPQPEELPVQLTVTTKPNAKKTTITQLAATTTAAAGGGGGLPPSNIQDMTISLIPE